MVLTPVCAAYFFSQSTHYLCAHWVQVSVVQPEDRQYSVFRGAAALASLESFLPQWITKEEYEGVFFLLLAFGLRMLVLCAARS